MTNFQQDMLIFIQQRESVTLADLPVNGSTHVSLHLELLDVRLLAVDEGVHGYFFVILLLFDVFLPFYSSDVPELELLLTLLPFGLLNGLLISDYHFIQLKSLAGKGLGTYELEVVLVLNNSVSEQVLGSADSLLLFLLGLVLVIRCIVFV